MKLQALLLGVLLGGGCVAAWSLSSEPVGGGVSAARQIPAADLSEKADCCLIPANRGLHRDQP